MSNVRRRQGWIVVPQPIATGSQSRNWGSRSGAAPFGWPADKVEKYSNRNILELCEYRNICTSNPVSIIMHV